jgi:hypothetical protein
VRWIVLCADEYAGEWSVTDHAEAEKHARTLDATCSCGGPHVVIEDDSIERADV